MNDPLAAGEPLYSEALPHMQLGHLHDWQKYGKLPC